MVEGGSLVFVIILVISFFFLFLVLFGLVWFIVYLVMFVWVVLFSGKKLNWQIVDIVFREVLLRELYGCDFFIMIDGGYCSDIIFCGVVWIGVVFGFSYWYLLIGWFNNLIGGLIDIF